MNPWAHIDALKKKHADEIDAAVRKLMAAGFLGDVKGRLKWDGTHWIFPVSGMPVKARTLDALVAACTAGRGGVQ